jgi:hypothetical protein
MMPRKEGVQRGPHIVGLHYRKCPNKVAHRDRKQIGGCQGPGKEKRGECLLTGKGLPFGGMKELDSGDGCVTL